jgi:pre-mRNA-processing factor 17
MNAMTFNEQFYNYKKYGVMIDPSGGGDTYLVKKQTGEHYLDFTIDQVDQNSEAALTQSVFINNAQAKAQKAEIKSKRLKTGDAATGNWLGPWAPYEGDEVIEGGKNTMTDEQREILTKIEEKRKKKKALEEEEEDLVQTSTVFHLKESKDYLGRSYILPPAEMKYRPDQTCYIPKKHTHTFSGHKKGVVCAKFFPAYGHFILSGSFDTTVKLWDVYKNKGCVRTYMGHKEVIKDISLTNDGLHFLSASYDNKIIYWDTEVGKAVQTFDIKKHPYCVKFHPDDDRQHSFLCGSNHKKVTQYDVR